MRDRGCVAAQRLLCAALLLVSGCADTGPSSDASSTSGTSIERVSEKGPVKLKVVLSPPKPRLSDLIDMEIEVTAKPGIEIKPPTFGQAVGDFVVRDYTERRDKSEQKNADTITRRFHYKLEPMSAGRHLIRSFAIDFVDERPDSEQKGASVIESEPFEVEVTSELGDEIPNLANLDPMVPPQPLATSSSWIGWSLAVIAIIVVALIVWLRRRRKTQPVAPRQKAPEEIAREAFAALMAENLPAKGMFKDFYVRLTGIVRQFIEGTTGLRAPEQTTEEFLQAMRTKNVFSHERSLRLKEFLEAADMVKFAGQQPDHDQIELSITRAREFVDMRSPVSEPVTAGEA